MGIAIPFQGVIDQKYPDTETANFLGMLEDAVLARLEPIPAEFVLALTLPNVRELIVYTALPKEAQAALNSIRPQFPTTTFQHYVKHDPAWSGYEAFQLA
jgi:hypothetical protein